LIDKQVKLYQAFGEFLAGFVEDLNVLSEDRWSLLVEGKRDAIALRKLGFIGNLVTISSVGRKGISAFDGAKKVIILTDLDREGAVLASRYLKRLSHEGFRTSMRERRRLKIASRGIFLHVENLSRFALPED
jgi:5S rRNA maturation endonuclease (ribonuclease M5)